jgi:F-type H+-transporting ATPase subunit gamma
MANLIDLRRRIRSVRNTQQVTKAMKTVATAKYKKTSRAVAEGRPFWHSGPDFVDRLARWAGPAVHPLLDLRPERTVHVVVITSDKGLCGAFNSSLLARTRVFLTEKTRSAEVRLVLIGKKAANFFRRQAFPIDKAFAEGSDKLDPETVRGLARRLTERFLFRETDAIYVAYNEFKSVLAPKITIARVLPLTAAEAGPAAAAEEAGPPPDWEPGAAAMVAALLPRHVEDQVLHAYAESLASEQAARMMAMENASNNAGELIERLTLGLNKARQASITKELLEIITAVEALKQ